MRYELIVTDFDDNELYRNLFRSVDAAVRNACCFDVRFCVLSLTDLFKCRSFPIYDLMEVFER